ncbi:hypothetical protein C4K25_1682 [Pseudomonas chlororaphis]|nr:hypothetical protein C4K25_1682 [Pseudomonas chlororaphis]
MLGSTPSVGASLLAKNGKGAVFIQDACVIVDDLREQARSYRDER